jgi:hypothetical protein
VPVVGVAATAVGDAGCFGAPLGAGGSGRAVEIDPDGGRLSPACPAGGRSVLAFPDAFNGCLASPG